MQSLKKKSDNLGKVLQEKINTAPAHYYFGCPSDPFLSLKPFWF